MIRVLVVDDSPSVRELLAYILGSDPEIEIVGRAADGEDAVRMTQAYRPDVITMDLHMPNMNGLDATRKIMQTCPTPIVIVSGSEDRGEIGASFRAIEAGALVVVQRPLGPGNPGHNETSKTLVKTVKSMAEVKVVRRWARDAVRAKDRVTERAAQPQRPRRKLVVLGASTGGPAVLREILAELPADYALPIVIVQHMSSGFVKGFADWLSSATPISVGIAEHDAPLSDGCAFLAPDGYHAGITEDLRICLTRGQPEYGMCPSVSHLFRSVGKTLSPSTAAVLLTGMGKDGALELRRLKESGALTIVQDRATSAVYGMPGEAIKLDAARLILEPAEIGKTLRAFGEDISSHFPFQAI
jgi:two-component system chemotaxis response regulator CheB